VGFPVRLPYISYNAGSHPPLLMSHKLLTRSFSSVRFSSFRNCFQTV